MAIASGGSLLQPSGVVRARRQPDLISLTEAVYTSSESNDDWLSRVLDVAERGLGQGAACGLSVIREHADGSGRSLELAEGRGHGHSTLDMAGNVVENMDDSAYREFWYPCKRVLLASSIVDAAPPGARILYDWYLKQTGAQEFLGLLGHPAPGWAFVLFCDWPESGPLDSAQRDSLERLRIHLESVLRLRLQGAGQPVAVLTPEGRLIHSEAGTNDDLQFADAHGEAASERVRSIEGARTKAGRSEPEHALLVWKALVDGSWSLLEHVDGDGKRFYQAYENAPAARAYRCLTRRESAVLDHASQGLSGKHVAYALGIAQTVVSRNLASAALKLGFRDRADLLRCASALLERSPVFTPHEPLSHAEADVLELLQLGHSNQTIATLRSRSVATIANQVSSILRKTGAPNRRALMIGGLDKAEH